MLSKPIALVTLAVLTLSVAGVAQAQPTDLSTYFTFSRPVTLPGTTLPAGKYLFRIADVTGSRRVINILSGDGKKSFAMLHTIPNQAQRAPSDPEIRFMETSSTVPPPVKTWWYPGRSIGYEFIYPRRQAQELAKVTREPVLTTTRDTTVSDRADLSRIDGEGRPTSVTVEESPAPVVAAGRAQVGEVAAPEERNTLAGAAAAQAPQSPSADERARANTRTQLPRTASPIPTMALVGVVMLALGVGLSPRRVDA